MRASRRPTGPGFFCRKRPRSQKPIYSVLLRRSSIIPSDVVPSVQRFSKSTFPPIAIRPAFTESWAEGGPLDTFYAKDGGPLGIWRQWAPHAEGQAMKGGHFFPERTLMTPHF